MGWRRVQRAWRHQRHSRDERGRASGQSPYRRSSGRQPAPAKNAYGAAFNPDNLKWNFTHADRTVPFFEFGGGVLFTNNVVPANTSRANFLTHGAFGLQFFNSE